MKSFITELSDQNDMQDFALKFEWTDEQVFKSFGFTVGFKTR
jgi:hypothetical protein